MITFIPTWLWIIQIVLIVFVLIVKIIVLIDCHNTYESPESRRAYWRKVHKRTMDEHEAKRKVKEQQK